MMEGELYIALAVSIVEEIIWYFPPRFDRSICLLSRISVNLEDMPDFLVCTGSGKTRIALNLIMSKLPQMRAQGQVAVMLCPTVPLVLQVRMLQPLVCILHRCT